MSHVSVSDLVMNASEIDMNVLGNYSSLINLNRTVRTLQDCRTIIKDLASLANNQEQKESLQDITRSLDEELGPIIKVLSSHKRLKENFQLKCDEVTDLKERIKVLENRDVDKNRRMNSTLGKRSHNHKISMIEKLIEFSGLDVSEMTYSDFASEIGSMIKEKQEEKVSVAEKETNKLTREDLDALKVTCEEHLYKNNLSHLRERHAFLFNGEFTCVECGTNGIFVIKKTTSFSVVMDFLNKT